MGVALARLLPEPQWLRIRDEATLVRRLDYQRHPILMQVDSWIENNVRLHSCKKEPGTIEWIETWFKPGDVFYDIGANVGAYSLVAFRFLNGGTNVYAFEPGFVTFPQLCKNVHLNEAGEAIIPLQVALSDQTSIAEFHYQNLTSGGALHTLGTPTDLLGNRFKPVFTLHTLTCRLDDFVQQFGLRVPNHIKIDVDGTEYQILKGSGELLGHPQLHTVLVEANEEREGADKIEGLLEEHGLVEHSRPDENILYCRKGS